MIELPRITRALRAHTQLDKPRCLKPVLDPTKPLLVNRKSKQKFKSFTDIYDYIKQNESNTEVLKLLEQLKESCKLLTGDQSDEVIEDATVMSLRMFLDQDIVMLKHLTLLRQTFGTVLSSTANKICGIVSEISTEISEETKEYIRKEMSEESKENIKLWGDHIQCHYIPYKPAKKPLAKLLKKPATDSSFVTDFSMKYSAQQNEEIASKPAPVSKFGKAWLEKKVTELYMDTPDISSADIIVIGLN